MFSEAKVVVVGADECETRYAFDALVEDEDSGGFISSKVQFVNNDILTDCVLAKDFKELRISCGEMHWVLSSSKTRLFPGGKFMADATEGTEATASLEIEELDGDGGNDNALAVSTLIIDTSPGADFWDEPKSKDDSQRTLGKISYKFNGEMRIAQCLPYGRVQAQSGQVFERVDSWLQSLKRQQVDME